jgi:hypothetical protein
MPRPWPSNGLKTGRSAATVAVTEVGMLTMNAKKPPAEAGGFF